MRNIGYGDTKNKKDCGCGTPLYATEPPKDSRIKELKERLKDRKQARREYRRSKPWKKNESRTSDGKPQWYKEDDGWAESEQYETRSEHKASMLEEDESVQNARKDLRAARKARRKN